MDDMGGQSYTSNVVLYTLWNIVCVTANRYTRTFFITIWNFPQNSWLLTLITAQALYAQNGNSIEKKSERKFWKKGVTISCYSDSIIIGKWKDKRPVLYLLIEFENEIVKIIKKRSVQTYKTSDNYSI